MKRRALALLLAVGLTTGQATSTGLLQSGGYTLTVSAGDVTARNAAGKTVYSLRAALMTGRDPACAARLTARPLSFAAGVLAVQVTGSSCLARPDGDMDMVYTVALGQAVASRRPLSSFVGEGALVQALSRDPVLRPRLIGRGQTLVDLQLQLPPATDVDGCVVAPSPLEIANLSYAFWSYAAGQVTARAALPLQCGGQQVNSHAWLGLVLPLPASARAAFVAASTGRAGFLYTNRPALSAQLRW
jgi:hypothetical protein